MVPQCVHIFLGQTLPPTGSRSGVLSRALLPSFFFLFQNIQNSFETSVPTGHLNTGILKHTTGFGRVKNLYCLIIRGKQM